MALTTLSGHLEQVFIQKEVIFRDLTEQILEKDGPQSNEDYKH